MIYKALLASSAAISIFASALSAETVRIATRDGSLSVEGELLSYDNGVFSIASEIGVLNFPEAAVNCEGAGCPVLAPAWENLKVAQSPALDDFPFPALFRGYGTALKLSVSEQDEGMYTFGVDGDFQMHLVPAAKDAQAASDDAALVVAEQGSPLLSDAEDMSVLALDALVFAKSPQNPVRAIGLEAAAGVFSGQITNWRELGGPDAPITAYMVDPESPDAGLFSNSILAPFGLSIGDNVIRVRDVGLISDLVAQDPNAVGLTKFSQMNGVEQLAIRGSCGIQTKASPFTIKTEEYPLTQRIFTTVSEDAATAANVSLGEFLVSNEAQEIVAESGYVDQLFTEVSAEAQGLRFMSSVLPSDAEVELGSLRELISDLVYADRTSITFRFASGTSRLDTRANNDLDRLAQEISDGHFSGKEVLFLGFTDSVGRGELNQVLSQARATQVRDALQRMIPAEAGEAVPLNVVGYGEMMPLACNETETGRRINRRVEVWVRDRV